jgi:glycosyltransferase involved in cell wall biosynthesis
VSKRPVVSIICITYNQEKFIAKALDGFLMQKTTFPFEIIIHDDASTDKTPSIIRQYAKKHPDIFKPTYEEVNQYSTSKWQFLCDMYYAARGKYIAMCEGDDFWTDPRKLQKQVDFLEANQDYALCFHSVKVFFEDKEEKEYISPRKEDAAEYTIANLLKSNYIHTNTVMYRAQAYKDLPANIMPHDVYMHLYHARFGKIGFISDVMSAYRRQSGGVWWDSYGNMDGIYTRHRPLLINFYVELLKILKAKKYKDIIYDHLIYMFNRFTVIDSEKKLDLMGATIKEYPELIYVYLRERNKRTDAEIIRLTRDVEELKTYNGELEKRLGRTARELDKLKSTLTHRTKESFKRFAKKVTSVGSAKKDSK